MKNMFMFPGQGSQTLKMGFELYQKYDVAKSIFNQVDQALGFKLSDIIFGDDEEKLLFTENTQPALMTVSIATLRCLEQEKQKNANQMCDFVAGHSLGEYSALHCAGVLSLEDTAYLLQIRGKAMAEACKKNQGSMIALLGADIEKSEELCKKAGGTLVIANDNANGQIVLSGENNAINRAIDIANSLGIKKAIKLNVQGAFHSPLMEYAQDIMINEISKVHFTTPQIPIFANFTAQLVKNIDEIKDLLIKQITGRVRWRETLFNAQANGVNKMIEIGNGKVLAGLAKRTLDNIDIYNINNLEDLLINNYLDI